VPVVFHIMSKCPYAAQVLKPMATVVESMGDWLDFRLEFIGTDGEEGQLGSLHGEPEVLGDRALACGQAHLPGLEPYFRLVRCVMEDFRSLPGNWEPCATRMGLDAHIPDLRACYDGEESNRLLRQSFKASATAGARGSPTMFIAGREYRGPRTVAAFTRAICAGMTAERQAGQCAALPKPLAFKAIVIGDKRCRDRHCNIDSTVKNFKSLFPGMTVRELDWSSGEAKLLYQDEGLEYLPAMLFSPIVEKAEEYGRLRRHLSAGRTGAWLVFNRRSRHDPTLELCDNGEDDTGDGLADCEDPHCRGSLVCRPETPGKLELFVMSQCPYAVKAFRALGPVLKAFAGDPLKLEIHYIGGVSEGRPTALHGQPEVDENIRQLCVKQHYPEQLMDYIWCRGPNIRSSDWEPCATDGIQAGVIRGCLEGPGTEMLLKDCTLAQSLDIGASPTWLINGSQRFNGVDPGVIQSHICKHNPEFGGCKVDLEEKVGEPPPDGCK